jgi:hypothetical protein
MFGLFKKKRPPAFPPVPAWRPDFAQSLASVIERARLYSGGTRDFAVFRHGTLAILPPGLSHAQAVEHAKSALHQVFHAHPDMNPLAMKDGNLLIQYSRDVANIVLADVVKAHWDEIEGKHQAALATHEVLITPRGPNAFDDHGKKALFGRCYMFMDAQDPEVVRIERASS